MRNDRDVENPMVIDSLWENSESYDKDVELVKFTIRIDTRTLTDDQSADLYYDIDDVGIKGMPDDYYWHADAVQYENVGFTLDYYPLGAEEKRWGLEIRGEVPEKTLEDIYDRIGKYYPTRDSWKDYIKCWEIR